MFTTLGDGPGDQWLPLIFWRSGLSVSTSTVPPTTFCVIVGPLVFDVRYFFEREADKLFPSNSALRVGPRLSLSFRANGFHQSAAVAIPSDMLSVRASETMTGFTILLLRSWPRFLATLPGRGQSFGGAEFPKPRAACPGEFHNLKTAGRWLAHFAKAAMNSTNCAVAAFDVAWNRPKVARRRRPGGTGFKSVPRPVFELAKVARSRRGFAIYMPASLSQKFGFVGTGRMSTALARGFLAAGLAEAQQLLGSDPSPAAADQFSRSTGARIVADNAAVAAGSEVVVLAVKPQQMGEVLAGLRGKLTAAHLVVSVAAGVPLAALSAGLGPGPRLVRVMPNTPCLVGQGASGYCLGPGATAGDGQLIGQLLSAVGQAYAVDEKLLDAVTGLSGSGPAFVCVMIEALADGGVRMGLPRAVAQGLAAQTLLGTAQMVLATGEHPAALKDQVASPGGTTIAGLQALEAGGLRAALIAAVEAATRRSIELGK